jgi:hypothetical protein
MHCGLQSIVVPSKVASKEEYQGESTISFVTAVSDYGLTFCISEKNNIKIYSTCCAKANSRDF